MIHVFMAKTTPTLLYIYSVYIDKEFLTFESDLEADIKKYGGGKSGCRKVGEVFG